MRWVAESDWGYPIVLTTHALGMALVIGIMMMLNLRVLGFAARVPLTSVGNFFPVAWTGLAINLVSGSLLFLANYTAFLHNAAFLTKMSCLALGAALTWRLVREIKARYKSDTEAEASPRGKVLAALCMLLWIAAITAGRIVGYTSVPE